MPHAAIRKWMSFWRNWPKWKKGRTTRLPGKTKVVAGDEVALAVDLDSVSYFDPETQLRIE